MRHKALFARRSPPRLSRWRSVRPEDAGIGDTPHRWAKAASERSRWGLSPAVTRSWPAVSTPIPGRATRVGAAALTSFWSWVSSRVSSAWSCCQRRARVRSVVLVAAVGLVKGPGRMAAHELTRALVLRSSRGWRSSSGALESTSWSCSAAATLALRAPRRATRSTRIISTWPSRVLGIVVPPRPGWPGGGLASIGSDCRVGDGCWRACRPRPLGGRSAGEGPGRRRRCGANGTPGGWPPRPGRSSSPSRPLRGPPGSRPGAPAGPGPPASPHDCSGAGSGLKSQSSGSPHASMPTALGWAAA